MVVVQADVVLADAAVVAADVAGHSLGLVDEYYSAADADSDADSAADEC